MLTLACALAYTYIIASQSAYVTGANAAESQSYLAMYGGSPLRYRNNGRAIASVVFLWPGTVFTFIRHVESLLVENLWNFKLTLIEAHTCYGTR